MAAPTLHRRARGPALGAAVLVLAGAAGAPPAAASTEACATLVDRRLQICTAYVVNATLLARVPFYLAAGTENDTLLRLARHRLESRYRGAARAAIVAQVAAWPPGDVDVEAHDVDIDAVSVGPRGRRAVLRTRETWLVRKRHSATGAATAVFQEVDRAHDVTMARVRGIVLHKWVVVAITNLVP
jgi:hypothetical protein